MLSKTSTKQQYNKNENKDLGHRTKHIQNNIKTKTYTIYILFLKDL
jgi:hypothetical protein